MPKIPDPLLLLLSLCLAATACSPGTTRIKLETVLNQELPHEWEWVVSPSGQKHIITIADLVHVQQGGKHAAPASFSLSCPDAMTELRSLDQTLLSLHRAPPAKGKEADADADPPMPRLRYFTVQNATFRYVDFASNLGSVSTSMGSQVDQNALSVQYKQKSMLVNLAILYTEYMISTRDEYLECVRASLKDAGLHGSFSVPTDMLVGGMVILTFSAKNRNGKSSVKAGDLAHAEVEIDLNDVKVSFYQWGSTRSDLKGSELLEPLRAESPDPLASIGKLRSKVDKHGIVAIRRTELRL